MIIEKDISTELYREYDIPGRDEPYRIEFPLKLFMRDEGTTHRILDCNNVVHCLLAPGEKGCVLRWQNWPNQKPCKF